MPLRDLLTGVLWPAGLLGGTVNWRGTVHRIGPGTRIEIQDDPEASEPAWTPAVS